MLAGLESGPCLLRLCCLPFPGVLEHPPSSPEAIRPHRGTTQFSRQSSGAPGGGGCQGRPRQHITGGRRLKSTSESGHRVSSGSRRATRRRRR